MDDIGQKKAPLHEKLGVLTILGDQWRRMQWGPYKRSVLIAMYHNVAGVTTNKLSEIMRLLTKLIKRFWHWFTGFDCRYEEYKACDHDADKDKEQEKKPRQGGWVC